METFEIIWDSSRNNAYSWMYPATLWCGVGMLCALSFLKNRMRRRVDKLIAIAAFTLLATVTSDLAIGEKWRLRREWAERHPSQMSDKAQHALTVDGANLALGPVIDGFQAFLLFVGVAVALSIVGKFVSRRRAETAEQDTTAAPNLGPAIISNNPYHPPNEIS